MAMFRIEMDRGNGWTVRQQGEAAVSAAELIDVLPDYAIQYPHRAFLDGKLVATAEPRPKEYKPGPGARIEAIYAWIATEADGGEGIPATVIGGMLTPLVGADRARIESLRPEALTCAVELGLPVKLVRFDGATVLETLPVLDRREGQ